MSADNYLYIYPIGEKFGVEMRFASCDYDELGSGGHRAIFDKLSEAIAYAEENSAGEYPDNWTEYGYSISSLITEKQPTYVALLKEWERAGRPSLPLE